MSAIQPKDWLDWHSLKTAQGCAIRLLCASSAILPSDKNLQNLVEGEIIPDLLSLALHGRRTMERYDARDTVLNSDPIWPASQSSPPNGTKLYDVFGIILHANSILVQWEASDVEPAPYKGRAQYFAGGIQIVSDKYKEKLPTGSIATAYVQFSNNNLAKLNN